MNAINVIFMLRNTYYTKYTIKRYLFHIKIIQQTMRRRFVCTQLVNSFPSLAVFLS